MNGKVQQWIEYYRRQGAPGDQTALIALLREIQQENGNALPPSLLPELAQALAVKENYLLALIRRIPSLHLAGNPVLELCAGPNCGKHRKLAAFAEELCARTGTQLRYMPCMRLCGKGPNLKYNGTLYHKVDEALLERLLGKK